MLNLKQKQDIFPTRKGTKPNYVNDAENDFITTVSFELHLATFVDPLEALSEKIHRVAQKRARVLIWIILEVSGPKSQFR